MTRFTQMLILISTMCIVLAIFGCVYNSWWTVTTLFTSKKAAKQATMHSTKQHKDEMEMTSEELNRVYPVATRVMNQSIVIYNRVPKCASSFMTSIIRKQKSLLKYNVLWVYRPKLSHYLEDKVEQLQLMRNISGLPRPTIYIRHLHFLEFESGWPIYINVIREPVDHFISTYHYKRFGFEADHGKPSRNWPSSKSNVTLHMTLEECVVKNLKSCVKANVLNQLPYFCGHEKKCRDYTTYALQKAKLNLSKRYAIVGLTEDLQNTKKLLNALLPRYFNRDVKVEDFATERDKTRTYKRKEPPKYVKELLRKELKIEMEFYSFAKMRFYKQLNELDLV